MNATIGAEMKKTWEVFAVEFFFIYLDNPAHFIWQKKGKKGF